MDPGRRAGWSWGRPFTSWCRCLWDRFSGSASPSRRDELEGLKQEAANMEETLDRIKERIDELESEKQTQEN